MTIHTVNDKDLFLKRFHKAKDKIEYMEGRFNYTCNKSWFVVSKLDLDYEFIKHFQDKLYWSQISRKPYWPIDFILEFQDQIFWERVSLHNTQLTNEFIDEYSHVLYVDIILERKTELRLTEDLINKLKEIYKFQKLLQLEKPKYTYLDANFVIFTPDPGF